MAENGPEHWARLDELYHAALEQPEEQRDAFLRSACGGDEALQREVLALLEFHGHEGFLDKPPAEIAARLEAAINDPAPGAPQSGQIISHYKVTEKLGQGGMGVVYRAEDLNLDRTVALKFLSPSAIEDPSGKERLIREAKAAAALDHPNVCTVYEIGETDSGLFLAMALVDGWRLSDRIAKQPLKLAEALDIAIQTAQGLQSAHEKGIVHRDIKSSNLMINRQGQVKIMDFGIAQLANQERLTRTLTIVGSPGYLSPEQAQGQKADSRSDIWSLGVVLYEMVTGQLPFKSEQRDALLHSIIHDEHEPVTALRVGLPVELDRILAKALAKDPGERYQHADELIVDLRRLAKQSRSAPTLTTSHRERRLKQGLYAAALLVVLALAALGAVLWRQAKPAPDETVRRFSIPFEPVRPVISPNGRHIAYRWDDSLWIRDLNSETPREIPAGKGKGYNKAPTAPGSFYLTWSPDSRELVFATPEQELRRVSVAEGGPATIVCKLPPVPQGAPGRMRALSGMAWSKDGATIVFSLYDPAGGIYEVPASGGSPKLLWKEMHADDLFLLDTPDGRAVVFASLDPRDEFTGHALMIRTPSGERRKLATLDTSFPELIYSPTGHILFRKDPQSTPSIWAIPFSADTLQTHGGPFPVARSGQAMSLSDEGTLVYLDGGRNRQFLAWRDRKGNMLSRASDTHEVIQGVSLSQDGNRAIVTARDDSPPVFWIYDVQRFTKSRFDPGREVVGRRAMGAAWARHRNEVIYTLLRPEPDVGMESFAKPPDEAGEGRRIPLSGVFAAFMDSTADGQHHLSIRGDPIAQDKPKIWVSRGSTSGGRGGEVQFSPDRAEESAPMLSPNERYVVYTSHVDGPWQVYVRPFPEGPGRWQISTTRGSAPIWGPDGKELFFSEGIRLMRARVTTNGPFAAGAPELLFEHGRLSGELAFPSYDVSPDGKKFLMIETERELPKPVMRVVENWVSEFRGATPSRK